MENYNSKKIFIIDEGIFWIHKPFERDQNTLEISENIL